MAGVKGKSGRKTIRNEWKDIQEAHRIFFGEHDQEELERRIASGKASLADRFILSGLEGDTAILTKAYQKAVPDMIDHTTDGAKIETQPILVRFLNDAKPTNNGDTQ